MQEARTAHTMAKVARTVKRDPYVLVDDVPERLSVLNEKKALLKELPKNDRSRPRLEREVEKLAAVRIRGLLQPIAEQDWWIVQAKYSAAHLYLSRQRNRVVAAVGEGDLQDWAVDAALDIQEKAVWNQAIVLEALLRADENGKPVLDLQGNPLRYFPDHEAVRRADPVTIQTLSDRYLEEFHVSPEEMEADPTEPAETP